MKITCIEYLIVKKMINCKFYKFPNMAIVTKLHVWRNFPMPHLLNFLIF